MSRKPKFKPEITRVRLNPEQAVLFCDCPTGLVAGDGTVKVREGQDVCYSGMFQIPTKVMFDPEGGYQVGVPASLPAAVS